MSKVERQKYEIQIILLPFYFYTEAILSSVFYGVDKRFDLPLVRPQNPFGFGEVMVSILYRSAVQYNA